MHFGSLQKAFLVSALSVAGPCASAPPTLAQDAPAAQGALRLCADPDNLPFSSNDPVNPGIYNEIGDPCDFVFKRCVFARIPTTSLSRAAIRPIPASIMRSATQSAGRLIGQ